MPVIGFLTAGSPDDVGATWLRAFRQGLSETGYVEGQNVAIEYRWAEGQYDRLPALAADLVRRTGGVIATPGSSARRLRPRRRPRPSRSSSRVGDDPVRLGLVASLTRPGGNATGVNFFTAELAAKRLELLRELVPERRAYRRARQSDQSASAETTVRDVQAAAPRPRAANSNPQRQHQRRDRRGLRNPRARARRRAVRRPATRSSTAGACNSPTLAARHAIPAIYAMRDFAEAGGLMSYGTSLADTLSPGRRLCRPHPQGREARRPAGACSRPSSSSSSTCKTAKALGLDVPPIAARPRRRGDRMMGWMAPLRHLGAKVLVGENQSANKEPSMSEITTVGLDLAKHVFQVHGVDAEGATVLRKQLRRAQVLAFFSRLPRCLVGMEACATAHYWARELRALGHEVRLMPAQYVKAYVKRNKNDAADAEAICEAVVRPTMRFVPVKTAEQQAAVLLHRGRERLVRQRTMLVNALRGHLAEFGVIAPQGLRNVGRLIAIVRDEGTRVCRIWRARCCRCSPHRLSSSRQRLRR